MARKFLTNIDLNLSELQNAVIQNLASDPTTGNTDGRIYYNTVSDELRVYANGSWTGVGAGDIVDIQGTADEVTVSIVNGVATISLPATINAATTGNAATATKLATARAIELSGDVTGTANFDGSAAINISTSIAANSVALGTDTTGNYVATVTGTENQVTVSGSGSETAAVTLSLPQDIATTSSPTFNGVTAGNVKVGVTGDNEIDTSSGSLTIDSAGGTTTVDDNLIVTGNLTVQGTTTTLDTQTLNVEDNIITVNYGQTGTPALNAGIEVERGDLTNTSLLWNETSDTWTLTNDGTNYQDISRKYSANVGDGTNTSFAITHNLGTRDVVVNIYDSSTYETVEADVVRTSTTVVTVSFTSVPSSNAYRVVIVG